MATVNGNITITKGSQDYVDIQLLEDDGVTPIPTTGATAHILRLRNLAGTDIKKFSDTDAPQKLYITSEALGKLQLRQAAADFNTVDTYEWYVERIDSVGSHPIPDNKRYDWEVIDSIPNPA